MKRKHYIILMAFGLVLFLARVLPVFAQEPKELPPPRFGAEGELRIQAVSRITSVTVFPDRATLVRETDIKPVLGPQSVVFSGLPVTLVANSLRASGRGTAAVKILGLDAENEYQDAALLPEVKKLQAEVDEVTFRLAKLRTDADIFDAQEKFLMSIQASTASKAGEQTAQGRPDVQGWDKVLDFLVTKLQALKEKELNLQKEVKTNEAQLDALKKKLDSIKPTRPTESRKVSVLIEASQFGDFKLALSYTVMNARWVPLYTMRALPDTGELELSVTGIIQQRSGENWENVKAQLSTASPALESQPAELTPWTLDIYVPRPVQSAPKMASRGEVVGGIAGGVVGGAMAPAPPLREAELDTAAITESGLHLNFEIKRPVDIPSDGAPHKVPIDAQKLKVKFDYVAVPKLKETTFLRGTWTNTLAYPLLPGNADLFISQDFVGTTRLGHVPANDEAKLYFGEDRQIKVTYEQVKREKAGAAFLGKTEKLRLVYKITLQNLRKTPASVDVLDQLPVSQNTKIEVSNVVIQPPTAKKDEKGILTWTLTLGPQEKKEIMIDFTIEFPKDATIIGI